MAAIFFWALDSAADRAFFFWYDGNGRGTIVQGVAAVTR